MQRSRKVGSSDGINLFSFVVPSRITGSDDALFNQETVIPT